MEINHTKAYKTNAVMIMKPIIEPNKTVTSLIKTFVVIVGNFVAL